MTATFPQYGLPIEDAPEIEGSDQGRWIIDSLDGDANFARDLPHWAVTIALEVNVEIVAAVVHDPLRREIFSASRDEGAWLNGETRLQIAQGGVLRDAVLATGMPDAT